MVDKFEENPDYKSFGMLGNNSLFDIIYCENDRLWRKQLLLTPEAEQDNEYYAFDECNNAYMKPKPVKKIDILSTLHKRSSYA